MIRDLRHIALLAAMSLALASPPSPTAAATDPARSIKYYDDARQRLKKGEVRAAIIQLKNALQQDPDNVNARYLLGTIYLQVGDGASSEKELKAALKRGFDADKIAVPLGRAYLLQGKFQTVLDEIQRDARGREIEADVLLVRGAAYLRLGQFDKAEAAFTEADRARPRHAPTKVAMARLFLARQKLAEAEAQADAALALAPDLSQALLLKGEIRRFRRDAKGSLKYFDRALKIRANDVLAHLGRAAALIDLNRDEEARKDISAVYAVIPKHPLATYLSALILAKNGDNVGAQDTLQEALPALDRYPPAIFLRGVVEYALGQLELAETNLRRFLETNPDHLLAHKVLAATLVRKREGAKAAKVLKPLLNRHADDAQLLALFGNALMLERKYSEATEYFEKAAAAAPQASNMKTQLALGRLAIGEPEQAVRALESALENDPKAVRPGILLTLTHLRAGKFDQALKVAEQLEARLPNNPLPYNLKGAALIGTGDLAAARSSFEKALAIQPDYFPALNNLAQLDQRAGAREAARKRYTDFLARKPRHVGAMMALGTLAAAEGRTKEAITWWEKARAADSRALPPRLRLVNAYIARREPENALAVARELDGLAPDNPDVLNALGRAELAVGDVQTAVGTYRRLVARAPASAEAYRRLAQAQVAAKDPDAARNSLKRALEVNPDYAPAYATLVALQIRQKRVDEALKIATRLRERQPKSAAGDLLVGDVHMAAKRYSEAVRAYEAALAKQESTQLALRLYNARRAAGDKSGAVAGLEAWLKKHPRDKSARMVLGGGYIQLGRLDAAIEQYERLNASDPRNAIILNNLAWLYNEKGDHRALDIARRAQALAPESGAILDTLGWILVGRGAAEEALPLLRKAKDKLPDSPDVGYHYAVALYKAGRGAEARPVLREILDRHGDSDTAQAARELLKKIPGG